MAYQVIARKYRPQRFSDVVGQEHVTDTLAHAIEQKRIAHAYIFCGPRGTGKTTIARIFAKCLNCQNGPRVEFEDSDPRCKEIAEGRSLDVMEIDGASNNGVEQVRELRETCRYAPASWRFKIYIIDEVHMLSTAAFNALLKTLEEPPEHVKFMFATTDPEKVLPTILSRCQRFDLRRIPTALISKHLAHIAKQEKVQIDPAALYAIARGAEGALRDAESTLDQLISFCGDHVQEADVLSMFGLTAQAQLLDLSRAMLEGETEKVLRLLNDLAKHGKDLGRLLSDLLTHFRNLLIFQVSKGDLALLEVSENEAAALSDQSGLVSTEGLTRIMEVLAQAEIQLRDAASKKILIEIALINSIGARTAVSLESVLKRLQSLREPGGPELAPPRPAATAPEAPARAQRTIPAPPAAPPAKPIETSIEIREESHRPAAVAAVDLESLWGTLVEAVGRASAFARSYLLHAHPVSFAKNLLAIGFAPEFEEQLTLVDNPRNHSLLQTKMAELGHPNCQFKFVKADAPVGRPSTTPDPGPTPTRSPAPVQTQPSPTPAVVATAPPTPREKAAPVPFNKDQFKNDPLIQKALEIFKGQIVEVRV